MADLRHQLRRFLEGTTPVDVEQVLSGEIRVDSGPAPGARQSLLVALAAAATALIVIGIPALLVLDRGPASEVTEQPPGTTVPGSTTVPDTTPPTATSEPVLTTTRPVVGSSTTVPNEEPTVTSSVVIAPGVSAEWFVAPSCVSDIAVGPEGSAWAVCGSDLYRLQGGGWVPSAPGAPTGIFDIEIAGDGTLVVASWSAEGADSLGYDGYALSTFRAGSWSSTTFEIVGDIEVGPDGTVWAAIGEGCRPEPCDPAPLRRFEGGAWEPVTGTRPSRPTTTGETLFEWARVSVADDGTVWVTNALGGFLYRWDGSLTQVGDGVEATWVAPDGTLWALMSAAAQGEWGIRQYRDGTWIIELELASYRVIDMAFTAAGQIWAVLDGHGVMFFDGAEWKRFTTDDGLPTMDLTSVATGPGDEVWIGTAGGLVRVTLDH